MTSSVWTKLPNSAAPDPEICIDFLNNQCQQNKSTCGNVHTKYPFLWQVEVVNKWHNLPEFHVKELELEYRVAKSDGVHLTSVDPVSGEKYFDANLKWYADFDKMTLEGDNKRLKLRRLSTESRACNQSQFSTKYDWYFKDERSRWILYGQSVGRQNKAKSVPSLSTTSSSDDVEFEVAVNKLKSWFIQSAQNKYLLDFVKMTQTNQQTKVARPIRRRPAAATIVAGSGPATDYSITPMSDSPAKKYKWQFLDEHNRWIDYGGVSSGNDQSCVVTATSKDIEKEFSKNSKASIQIQSAKNRYNLDFGTMKQTNLQTNVVRNVRRVAEVADLTKQLSGLSLLGDEDEFCDGEYEWFFCDENNQWVKYGQVSSGNDQNCVPCQGSDDIEKHFRANGSEVMTLKSRQHTYELNFSTMMQTNLKTRVQRPMCRKAKGKDDGKLDEVAVSLHVAYEWFFKEDDGSWVKHGSKDPNSTFGSSDVEKHFRQNPSTNLTYNVAGNSYVLDFGNMTQTNTSTGKVREICRRKQVVSMSGFPSSAPTTNPLFTTVPSGKNVFTKTLGTNDGEYAKCLNIVRTTLPNCQPKNIFKVVNPYLKAAFENKKAYMKSMYPNVPYKEEILFHGTKPANVKAILEENIDWRLHGTSSGQASGRGAYFSNNAQMSRGYGTALFVCRVLVGLMTTGNAQTVRPGKDSANQPYDTTVNQPGNPSVFVKYDSAEYYPEYYLDC